MQDLAFQVFLHYVQYLLILTKLGLAKNKTLDTLFIQE